MHQMVHLHGDIALLGKEIPQMPSVPLENGHVRLEENTMAEDPFNSLSKLPVCLVKSIGFH